MPFACRKHADKFVRSCVNPSCRWKKTAENVEKLKICGNVWSIIFEWKVSWFIFWSMKVPMKFILNHDFDPALSHFIHKSQYFQSFSKFTLDKIFCNIFFEKSSESIPQVKSFSNLPAVASMNWRETSCRSFVLFYFTRLSNIRVMCCHWQGR